MFKVGQNVFYIESNKILRRKTILLGVVMRLKGKSKFVVVNSCGFVVGVICRTVQAVELTTFNGIRLEVIVR